MKFGVNTFIWSSSIDKTVLDLLPVFKEKGFDGFECPLFRASEFPAAELRKAADANGLEFTLCAVLVDGHNLIDPDAAGRKKSIAHVRDLIQAAAEAGAKILAGPIYSPVGYLPGRRRTTDEWNWAVEAHQALGDTLQAAVQARRSGI